MAYPFVSYSVHHTKESHTCRTHFFLPYLQDQDGLSRNRNFATVTSLFERVCHIIVLSLASVNVQRTSNNTVFSL